MERNRKFLTGMFAAGILLSLIASAQAAMKEDPRIGREVAIDKHLADGEEFSLPMNDLIAYGKKLFMANWTEEEGAERPLIKGTGSMLSEPTHPLVGTRGFNRISGPDANSCYGCHNEPYGIARGSGDFAGAVFVLGQRFGFLTFDPSDNMPDAGGR